MDRRSEDILDKTIAFWQPRTSRRLSREDARQMIENVSGFFSVLAEWEAKDRAAQSTPAGDPHAADPAH